MRLFFHYLTAFGLAATINLAGAAAAQESQYSPRQIQQALAERGYDPGKVDGLWGRRSINALKAFQKAQNLSQTGMMDEQTRKKLFSSPEVTREPLEPATPPPTVSAQKPDVQPAAPSSDAVDEAPAKGIAVVDENTRDGSSSTTSGGQVSGAAQQAPFEADPARQVTKTDKPQQPAKSSQPSASLGGLIDLFLIGLVVFLVVRWRRRRKAARQGTLVAAGNVGIELDRRGGPWEQASSNDGPGKTQPVEKRPVPRAPLAAVSSSSARWVPANTSITIGRHTIVRGMIYLGEHLPKQNDSHDDENCLINPRLAVANQGDPQGQTMSYWPSYARISAAARKSYLDWLAGPRSDPETNIGYVFLYFYGLERRLMLEESVPDGPVVEAEVRRLLDIYGRNGSFNRYASELLSAYELRSKVFAANYLPSIEGNGYEIPLALKVALGIRVRDGNPIEPDLLLSYVMAHPETRVRTPARRALPLLKELFAAEVQNRYPKGVRVSGERIRRLKASYRAASGTFEVEILPAGGILPDITARAEPINSARGIFDECTDRLDAYSRELGRSEGLRPTLAATAKLPAGTRRKKAQALGGQPLNRIEELVASGKATDVQGLVMLAGMNADKATGKARLVELSGLLAAFGYGHTADPAFSLKVAKPDEPVAVFHLGKEYDSGLVPSDNYRPVQLSMMLGMMVGLADGHLHELEHRQLSGAIDASALPPEERVRLKAEMTVQEADPKKLAEWTRRLIEVPESSRSRLADELVAVAAADGVLHSREVSQLEKLFRHMGMDEQLLYGRLHNGIASERDQSDRDGDLVTIIPAGEPQGRAIPPEPRKPANRRVDIERVNDMRKEMRTTASVLAEIFTDEEGADAEPVSSVTDLDPDPEEADGFDGLERRYGALLSELCERMEWPVSDFDQLVRNAGLLPGAARDALNHWSLDRFDELVLEGEDPIQVNVALLPPPLLSSSTAAQPERPSA